MLEHPPTAQVAFSNTALHAQRHGTLALAVNLEIAASILKRPSLQFRSSGIVGPHAQFHIKGSKVRVPVL